jgi:hypothetical protein
VWISIKTNAFKCIRICFYNFFPEHVDVAIKLYSIRNSTEFSIVLIEGFCQLIQSVEGNAGMAFMTTFLSQWKSYINSVLTLSCRVYTFRLVLHKILYY